MYWFKITIHIPMLQKFESDKCSNKISIHAHCGFIDSNFSWISSGAQEEASKIRRKRSHWKRKKRSILYANLEGNFKSAQFWVSEDRRRKTIKWIHACVIRRHFKLKRLENRSIFWSLQSNFWYTANFMTLMLYWKQDLNPNKVLLLEQTRF